MTTGSSRNSGTSIPLYIKRQCRVLLLVEALERVGVTPIQSAKLHAFAYLADVLSPVWGLPPFDGKILKIADGPHYPDLQRELDVLVFRGLIDVQNLSYVDRPGGGARIDAEYALRFESERLPKLLGALGSGDADDALDPRDIRLHQFLVDLAGAMSTLPDDEIDVAATRDATYANKNIAPQNIIDFGEWTDRSSNANRSLAVVERFDRFIPPDSALSPGERIYLYANFLGKQVNG